MREQKRVQQLQAQEREQALVLLLFYHKQPERRQR